MRGEVQRRLPKFWSEEEIEQLTELWENAKDDDGNFTAQYCRNFIILNINYNINFIADPVGLIFDGLRIKRSKPKIKEKLLELKLAEDPKQLRKKRSKKSDGDGTYSNFN